MEDLSHEQSSRPQRSRDTQAMNEVLDERQPCPWCCSRRTRLVQRGFTGPTDERDTYLICDDCDRTTLKVISKTMREMRVGQFRSGAMYRDSARQTKYTIERVLKVGMNEYLLYLKPIVRRSPT